MVLSYNNNNIKNTDRHQRDGSIIVTRTSAHRVVIRPNAYENHRRVRAKYKMYDGL